MQWAACRLPGISRIGFYAWEDRPMCRRRRIDLMLTGKITAIHRRSRDTYGADPAQENRCWGRGLLIALKEICGWQSLA